MDKNSLKNSEPEYAATIDFRSPENIQPRIKLKLTENSHKQIKKRGAKPESVIQSTRLLSTN